MNKTTIELGRNEHIEGYGYLAGPPWRQDSQNTLDKLVEWSAQPENAGKTIFKTFVRSETLPLEPLKYCYSSEHGLSNEKCEELFRAKMAEGYTGDRLVHNMGMIHRMRYVWDVFMCDIYWQ